MNAAPGRRQPPPLSGPALKLALAGLPGFGLLLGLYLSAIGVSDWPERVWAVATVPVLAALLVQIAVSIRRGDVGLDVVAALSMTAALVFGEELAACVVALMYGGGQFLESFAERRARREMTALLARVPRTAVLHRDGALEEIDIDAIAPGDRLLIRRGDVLPVDGTVAAGRAVLDLSVLTGESVPVRRIAGEAVMSGCTNAGEAFDLTATHRAAESTYAGILRLVEAAQRSKAPMSRLADRYAMVFLAATVCLAGGAWLATGDPIRAVAVLVVATPCPLILAVPVALVSGLSRAAGQGILIKGGRALEVLAEARSLILDKTGTLTEGSARVVAVRPAPGFSEQEVLRIAASLDQVSKHSAAQSLVAEARRRGLDLAVPADTRETPGEGVEGRIAAAIAVVGAPDFVASHLRPGAKGPDLRGHAPGSEVVLLAVDGEIAGEVVLADPLRAGVGSVLGELRALGLDRIVVATGDRREIAEHAVAGLPVDALRADLTPDQKVMVVLSERKFGPVLMVGDGINDAPALAAADAGIAMGAKGAAASAEAADVVLLVDEIDRLGAAIRISRRARFIALQSVMAGLGLSFAGMIAAAFGLLTPVQGALLQEAIDVSVILNALRVLRGDGTRLRPPSTSPRPH